MKNDPAYPTAVMRELFRAIRNIKTEEESVSFFRDLLTIAELNEFANRWQAVIMLRQGKSYMEIAAKLGMSTATVTRVAHWLHHGLGGYRTIASRLFKT